MNRPVRLAHVALWTRDVRQLADWYGMVLGASVTNTSDSTTLLSYDDEHHRLAIVDGRAFPDGTRAKRGLGHVGWAYNSEDDLRRVYEALARAGITPDRCIDHEVTRSMYYRDPDGNEIELLADVFTPAEANEIMIRRPLGRTTWDPRQS